MNAAPPSNERPRLLYVVTEDWYFLSHRLPMARAARDAGFEVHVATRVQNGAAAIAAEGFILHPTPFVRGRLSPIHALRSVRALRATYRAVKPDLIHHVAVQSAILGSLAATGLPVAIVNALTGLGYTFSSRSFAARMLRPVMGLLLKLLLNRPGRMALVQNPHDRDGLMALGLDPQRIALIPGSGVDVQHFQPATEPEGAVTLGFVGRLLDDKGIRALVAAHRLARESDPTLRLLIGGTPDPANPGSVSAREAEGWAGEPGIEWLGHVSDVRTLWARAHIAILPSRREGLPLSLLEAAACGRAMIATDVPGCVEIVHDSETGLLVPPDDPPALAQAIQVLARDPQRRRACAAAARRLVEARFSAEAIGSQIVTLYRRMLSGGAARDVG